jgi:2-isopropylmalate synthase
MDRTKITIFDTTLRDGEQSPGCSMNLKEKLAMARQLDRLGVDVIEAGFPIASQGDFESVEAVAREVRRPRIAGLARARKEDIDRCWEALRYAQHPFMHVFLATSDIHLQSKLKMSREQCLKQSAEMVAYARSFCPEVEYSAEDAMRTDLEFLLEVIEAVVQAGAHTVNLPDTVGYNVPSEMTRIFGEVCRRINGKYPDVLISTHCHNDLGLAVANSIAAVQVGARQVECTVNGLGERAGNAALEEVVAALAQHSDTLHATTDVDLDELVATSELVSRLTGVPVSAHKAVVGSNART